MRRERAARRAGWALGWLVPLAGCTPAGPAMVLPDLAEDHASTTILTWRDGDRPRGRVLAPEDGVRVPLGAEDLRLFGYHAVPAALGVAPGDELGLGGRVAPRPDVERRLVDGAWADFAPSPLPLELPGCPTASVTASGYCPEPGCTRPFRDRGDGVCWPESAGCLDGWLARTATAPCKLACGDGVRQPGEECDVGGDVDGCRECRLEPGWTCAEGSCRATACGDGIRAGDEGCDDGNTQRNDGCDSACVIQTGWSCEDEAGCHPICGNGRLNGDEACDDRNRTSGDGCDSDCHVEPGFSCSSLGRCSAVCGDRLVRGEKEACDDGNEVRGDGCDADCKLEAGWACPVGGGRCRREALGVPPVHFGWVWTSSASATVVVRNSAAPEPLEIEALAVGAPFVLQGGDCAAGLELDPGAACGSIVGVDGTAARRGPVAQLDVHFSTASERGWAVTSVAAFGCDNDLPSPASPVLAFDELDTLHVAGTEGTTRVLTRFDPALGLLQDRETSSVLSTSVRALTVAGGEALLGGWETRLDRDGKRLGVATLSRFSPSGSGPVVTATIGVVGEVRAILAGPNGPTVVGALVDPDSLDTSAFVLGLDPDLRPRGPPWTLTSSLADVASGIAVGPDGTIHIVGRLGGAAPGVLALGGADGFRARFRPDWTPIDVQAIGTDGDDAITGIVTTPCGVFVVGETTGRLSTGPKPGGQDVVVARLDDRSRVWSRLFGAADEDAAVGIVASPLGRPVIAWTDASGQSHLAELDPATGTTIAETTNVGAKLTGLAIDGAGRIFGVGLGPSPTNIGWCRTPNQNGAFVTYLGTTAAAPPACR